MFLKSMAGPDVYSGFTESQSMYLFPWLSLYFGAFGEVNLCCNFEGENILGTSEITDTQEEGLWNHEKIRQLRKRLLNGERVDYLQKTGANPEKNAGYLKNGEVFDTFRKHTT